MADELIPAEIQSKISDYFRRALERTQAAKYADPSGFRLGVARKRFKEGLTDQVSFVMELRLLSIPEEDITLELIAGELDYTYDYSMDLIAAWRDGVRKGNIPIATYRQYLTDLGMVPDRVAGYILGKWSGKKWTESRPL